MNHTNEFLRDYWTLAQRAKDFELNPLPDDTFPRTIRHLALVALLYVIYFVVLVELVPPVADFTDTGVGCIEDCLEPMEE